ncbi:MAG: UDP-N-acetylmuramoyl-L-alanine--D-glutamate ligase [Patescibacteria group bacterium]
MDFFKNKKITLMGLGLLGRGVGDAVFLAEAGADLTVTDLKSEAELASSIDQLKKFKNVKLVLGEHRLEDFRSADMVIKAAGVPLGSPFVAEAEKNNVPVVMSSAFFVKLSGVQTIGITGTRAKSTVTDMIYRVLSAVPPVASESLDPAPKIFLGGNVRGLSTLALLPEVKPSDIAVLELDSWQLQGFADFSPHIAVFTTFMPDHLNYYGGDMEPYFADKANIYRFQTPADFLIVSEQVAEFIKKFGPEPKSKMIVVHASDLPADLHLKIPGEHNRLNAALALAAVKILGDEREEGVSGGENIAADTQKILATYEGMHGRLSFVKKYKGVDIYNDTNSTTPDATIVALKAFPPAPAKKVVLIFGGADKKLDMKSLLEILPQYAKVLVVLPGTGTEIIRGELLKMSGECDLPVEFVSSMAEAVEKAVALAEEGDALIMSPGFASFGLFKNEYDRGDQFDDIVKKLG